MSAGEGCGPDGMEAKWRSARLDAFVGIDVSENQQDRIRWRVIRFEEFLDVFQSGRVEIVEIAVEIVRV